MSGVDDCSENDKEHSVAQEEAKYTSDSEKASKRSKRKESKKLAKENKAPKSKKQKRDHGERSSASILQSEPVLANSTQSIEPNEPIVAAVSKIDFFASLAASESQKPAVGTIHTAGKKVEKEKKDSNWTCQKCSTSNQNNAHECHKCKAIKRLTLYR